VSGGRLAVGILPGAMPAAPVLPENLVPENLRDSGLAGERGAGQTRPGPA